MFSIREGIFTKEKIFFSKLFFEFTLTRTIRNDLRKNIHVIVYYF